MRKSIAIFDDIQARYKKALLNLGKSQNTHIYDLREDYLGQIKGKEEGDFLIGVKAIYDSLGILARRIFLSESLEKGSIYPFWYYGLLSEKNMSMEANKIAKLCKEGL